MTLSNPIPPADLPVPRRLGALIAGGRSSRFGSDKALALLRGVPLIEHAARVLAPHVELTIVCGRDHPGFASVADVPEPGLGPLGGIAAALRAAEAAGIDTVLTIGCDMPDVPDALIADLIAGGSRYCASAPILGCWHASLAPGLEAHLASGGDRSVRRWAASVGIDAVEWEPLPNINRPEDMTS